MEIIKLKNNIGQPVVDDNFFGRKKEIQEVWDKLRSGKSIIFTPSRRAGKTSFAKKMIVEVKNKGWEAIEVYVPTYTSIEAVQDFCIQKLNPSNKTQIKSVGGDLKAAAVGGGAKIEFDNQTKSQNQLMGLALSKKKGRLFSKKEKTNILIVLDELVAALEIIEERQKGDAIKFLHWLNSLRIEYTNVRLIYLASMDIEYYIHEKLKCNPTIREFEQYSIDEFSEKEAKGCIRALCNYYNFTVAGETVQYILNKLILRLPYFIQLLFTKILIEMKKNQQSVLSEEIVNNAYNKAIQDKALKDFAYTILQYEDDKNYADKILELLSNKKEGVSKGNLFDQIYITVLDETKTDNILTRVLKRLETDGFIILNNAGKYSFRSPLLRDYWAIKNTKK